MKTNEPGNHDEPLRKVLKEWRSDAPLPPRFQESVWQRIERAQAPGAPSVWTLVAHWLGSLLPRPALATAYLAVLLAIGGTAGHAVVTAGCLRLRGVTERVRILSEDQSIAATSNLGRLTGFCAGRQVRFIGASRARQNNGGSGCK